MVKPKLQGRLRLSGDKSISHRYAMLAALADGVSTFENFAPSQDCAATLRGLRALGVPITTEGDTVYVAGRGPGGLSAPSHVLDAGNSGTTMRLLAGLLAGQSFSAELTGDASLQRRPMRRIIAPLSQMGAQITARADQYPPLHIQGAALRPIDYIMPVASAQVKSCVLLAGLFADGATRVQQPAPTRDHSERALRLFGAEVSVEGLSVRVHGRPRLRAVRARVPGDLSSAAFFVVAALMLPGSDLVIESVGLNETRMGLVRLLGAAGADITIHAGAEAGGESGGDLRVRYRKDFLDADTLIVAGDRVPNLIDEIPVLAVLGTQLRGGLVLRDAAELRVKESDRIARLVENLQRMGAAVTEQPDGMVIYGGQTLHGAPIATHGDHRIAMAFAIAGLMAHGEVSLDDPACVGVSFPDFFTALKQLLTA